VRVELHPDARTELRSAALWYEEQRDGLGGEFTLAAVAALDRISHAPESSHRGQVSATEIRSFTGN
jgi:hypothetical protein